MWDNGYSQDALWNLSQQCPFTADVFERKGRSLSEVCARHCPLSRRGLKSLMWASSYYMTLTSRQALVKSCGGPCPADFLCQFHGAAVNRSYELGGWKQPKSILSQFWRFEVQDQGVGRTTSLWKLQGRRLPGFFLASGDFRPSWHFLAGSCVTAVFASTVTWPFPLSKSAWHHLNS